MLRLLLLVVVVALAAGMYVVLGGEDDSLPVVAVSSDATRDVVESDETWAVPTIEAHESADVLADPLVVPTEAVLLEDTLPPAFVVTARIIGSDGEPLDRARGEFTSTRRKVREILGVGLSRSDGSVRLRVDSDVLESRRSTHSKEAFLVFADDHRIGGYEFELGERESLELGDISLSSGVRLAGVVTDSLGRRAAGCKVEVLPASTFDVTAKPTYPFRVRVNQKPDDRAPTYGTTDREGRWVVFVEPGDWVAAGELSSRASASTRVEVGEGGLDGVEIMIAVAPIAGRVVDEAGRPVKGATVRPNIGPEVITPSDGRFAFPSAAEDCSKVFASHPDYFDGRVLFDGERHDVQIVLEAGAALEVSFTGTDGLPVDVESAAELDVMLLRRTGQGDELADLSLFDVPGLRRALARYNLAGERHREKVNVPEHPVNSFHVRGAAAGHRCLEAGDYRVVVRRGTIEDGPLETIASVPFHVPDASPVALTVVIP